MRAMIGGLPARSVPTPGAEAGDSNPSTVAGLEAARYLVPKIFATSDLGLGGSSTWRGFGDLASGRAGEM